jgi:iron complex outermembrane receptor protein
MCSCAVRLSSGNSAVVSTLKCVLRSSCTASVRKVSVYKSSVCKNLARKTSVTVARACAVFIGFIFSAHTFFSNKKNKRKGNTQAPCLSGGKTKGSCRIGLLLSGLALLFSVSTYAQSDKVYNINIPAQSVSASLTELSEQTEQMLLFSYEVADTLSANPVVGHYTVMQALEIMLADTGYTGGLTQQGVLMISIKKSKASDDKTKGKMSMNMKKNILAMAVGSVLTGGVMAQDQSDVADDEMGWLLEEVVVTASKRGAGTSIQDTAMAISALTGEEVEKRGLVGMGDYLATIPGVSQADYGVGRNRISIRGVVTSSTEEASVASYLGEIPLSKVDSSGTTTDIKLVDIERIEVLRGPQGTLYGSGSLGGAVRNIPNAPNLAEFELNLNAGLSKTKEASGANNKTTGVINIPLIDNQLAMRVVAYRFENQGYTDIVSSSDPDMQALASATGALLLDKKGVGGSEFNGGRISVLWQPNDNLAVNLMHLTQDLEQDGFNEAIFDKGGYRNLAFDWSGHLVGSEFLGEDTDITSLTVEYDLGWGSLLSASTIRKDKTDRFRDLNRVGSFFAGTVQSGESDFDAFFQEFRLATEFEGALQFVGGVYYENIENVLLQHVAWVGDDALQSGRGLGSDPDGIFDQRVENHIQQTALFGEVSYAFSDQLALTLGSRWFEYDRRAFELRTGHFGGPTSDINSSESDSRNKVNLTYTPNEDVLLYAQWSQGFRLGKPLTPAINPACDADNDGILDGTSISATDPSLSADTLDNYELGGKLSLMDNRLTINTALYHIKWSDLPIAVSHTCGHVAQTNGGKATIQGLEIETSYALSDTLRMNVGASYSDGELTEDNSIGSKGDRLPLSPRSNANVGIEYFFQWADHDGFVRVDYAYVGNFYNDLQEATLQLGDYDKLSLRAGFSISDHLDIELYGNNLTNSDEPTILIFGLSNRTVRVPPAQFGVDLRYHF